MAKGHLDAASPLPFSAVLGRSRTIFRGGQSQWLALAFPLPLLFFHLLSILLLIARTQITSKLHLLVMKLLESTASLSSLSSLCFFCLRLKSNTSKNLSKCGRKALSEPRDGARALGHHDLTTTELTVSQQQGTLGSCPKKAHRYDCAFGVVKLHKAEATRAAVLRSSTVHLFKAFSTYCNLLLSYEPYSNRF